MDFGYDDTTKDHLERMNRFLVEFVYPAEPVFEEQAAAEPWARPPIVAELAAEARRQGLWNLFLTGEHGPGLTNLQYAPIAELTGRSPQLAPAAFNCAAP